MDLLKGGWSLLAHCDEATRSVRDPQKEFDVLPFNENNTIGWPMNENVVPSNAILNPYRLQFQDCDDFASYFLNDFAKVGLKVDNQLNAIQKLEFLQKKLSLFEPQRRWVSWKSGAAKCLPTQQQKFSFLNGGANQSIQFTTELVLLERERNNKSDGMLRGMTLVFGMNHSDDALFVNKEPKKKETKYYPNKWNFAKEKGTLYNYSEPYPLNLECSMGLELQFTLTKYKGMDNILTLYLHHLQRLCTFPDYQVPDNVKGIELTKILQPRLHALDHEGELREDYRTDSYTKIMTNLIKSVMTSSKAQALVLHDVVQNFVKRQLQIQKVFASLYNSVLLKDTCGFYTPYLSCNLVKNFVPFDARKNKTKNVLNTITIQYDVYTKEDVNNFNNKIFQQQLKNIVADEKFESLVEKVYVDAAKASLEIEPEILFQDFVQRVKIPSENILFVSNLLFNFLFHQPGFAFEDLTAFPILNSLDVTDDERMKLETYLRDLHPMNSRYYSFSESPTSLGNNLLIRKVPESYANLKNLTDVGNADYFKEKLAFFASHKAEAKAIVQEKYGFAESSLPSNVQNIIMLPEAPPFEPPQAPFQPVVLPVQFVPPQVVIPLVNDFQDKQIKKQSKNQCIDISGASTDDNAKVLLWKCKINDKDNQLFAYSKESGQITNKNSEKCLDANKMDGTDFVSQQTCNPYSITQKWDILENGLIKLRQEKSLKMRADRNSDNENELSIDKGGFKFQII